MNAADFLTAELARISWLEGGAEGLNGAKAVAFTIRNRVRAGWMGGSWSEVLSNHQQWSATLEPLPAEVPDPREPAFRALLQDISNIFNGMLEDTITVKVGSALAVAPPPALYFAYLDRITSPHFLENISQRFDLHKRVAQVGQLFFFS